MGKRRKSRDELLREIRRLRKQLAQAAAQAALVHEYRRTEAALRESEERYRRLFEDDLTGDYVATPEGRILACNPAFVAILKFADQREALEANMASLYADEREHAAFVQLLRERKKLERYEGVRRRRDGVLIHVVENAVGLFDERRNLLQIRGYLFDNTAHKLAEQALREAEQRYRNLIEFLPDAVLVSDGDKIVFANPAATRLVGGSRPEELVGRSLLGLFHLNHRPAVSLRTDRAVQEKLPGAPERRKIVRMDSQHVDVETAVTPIVFDGRQCVLRVNRDITARV